MQKHDCPNVCLGDEGVMSRLRMGRTGFCVLFVCLIWILSGAFSLLAHEPIRPGELEYLQANGLLEERLQFLDHLDNDDVGEHLQSKISEKVERARLEASGMTESEAEEATRQMSLPVPGDLPTSGSPKILTIMIDFADYRASSILPSLPASAIESNIYGNGTTWAQNNAQPFESLNRFWYRASQGQLNLSGNLLGWYNFPNNRSTYEPSSSGYTAQNQAIFDIVEEVLNHYDSLGHDFSQYDNDGDGDIDALQILWTGPDNGWANFWWAYKWSFYVSEASTKTWDGKRLRTFSWQWVSTRNGQSDFNPRVLCHEMGHLLGLPDLYDYTPTQNLRGGVGGFDIMDGNRGNPNAFLRWALDWITPAVISSGSQASQTLRASGDMTSNTNKAVVVFPGISNSAVDQEFFVVENRYRVGNDAGLSSLPTDGLAVWHVDSTLSGGDFAHSNADRNANDTRKLVKLIQADGLNEIESGGSFDAGDYYNAGEEFTESSNPSSAKYDGSDSNVRMTQISANGSTMTASIGIGGSSSGNTKAEMASPTPGSELTGNSITFEWSEGVNAEAYSLYVGSSAGGSDYHNSGVLSTATLSRAVSGIPVDGSTVYVRLWTQHDSNWSYNDYVYTAAPPSETKGVITAPDSGSTLGESAIFEWEAGRNADGYILYLGSAPGTANFWNSGELANTFLSQSVSGLPLDGSSIHARLFTRHGSVWSFNDYQYEAGMEEAVGTISSPANGSTVTGPTVTFTIDQGSGVNSFWMFVGTSLGGHNIYNSGQLSSDTTEIVATGIPEDGRKIFVRLWSSIYGTWYFRDYTFQTKPMGVTNGEITSPAPGSKLPGDTVTFQWDQGQSALGYWLSVGPTIGSREYHNSGLISNSANQRTVGGIERNGSNVFVRLWTKHASGWSYMDYTYQAADPSSNSVATLTSPSSGSTLNSSETTFAWNAGVNADQYWINVGSAPGERNILSRSLSNSTLSTTVSGLPYDGSTVYVRLWTRHGNTWTYLDYQFTAQTLNPTNGQVVSPSPGATLTSRTVQFRWNPGELALKYVLYVGTQVGARDLHFSGGLSKTTLWRSVGGLPANGSSVYVRLWTLHDSGWDFNDYTYTALTEISNGIIQAPAAGATLKGAIETFRWSAGGGAEGYMLSVGSALGDMDICSSGVLDRDTLSYSASGLPQDGSTVYVRLWTLYDDIWSWEDYSYVADSSAAEISSPVQGATLSGSAETFEWSGGANISYHALFVGSSVGRYDIFKSPLLDSNVTSKEVGNIPTDGRTLYVRLWSYTPQGWESFDYSYVAATIIPTKGDLTSHSDNEELTGNTETFEWNAGTQALGYWLFAGSGAGRSDFHNSGFLSPSTLTRVVSGLPRNGANVYVRLWTQHASGWTYTDYTFSTQYVEDENAIILSPTPGATLNTSSLTFEFQEGVNATRYFLYVGTKGVGSRDVFSEYVETVGAEVGGIPNDGKTLYVRLWSYFPLTGWKYEDYVYDTLDTTSGNTRAEMTAPAPDSSLTSSTVTFSWEAGTNAHAYFVYVGSSIGGRDLGSSGTLSYSTLSYTAENLPANGSTVYVRLFTNHNGSWTYYDYEYEAWNRTAPAIVSPTPGSTLNGYEWFNWDSNGAAVEGYYLDVGTSYGGSDIRYSEFLSSSATEQVVVGLPRDGSKIYVTMWYRIAGSWQSQRYEYVAAQVADDDVGNTMNDADDLGNDPSGEWTRNIDDGSDVDVYEINLTSKSVLTVLSEGSTDTYAYILNSSGVILAEDDDGGTDLNFHLSNTLLIGRYFVAVRSYGSNTGGYTISITSEPTLSQDVQESERRSGRDWGE